MLTIEGVLRTYASEPTMYSPNYFRSVSDFKAFLRSDRFYLLGWAVVNHSPTVVTLDSIKMYSHLDELDISLAPGKILIGKYDQSWVSNDVPVPPSHGWISQTEKTDMSRVQVRYLQVLDKTAPKYVYLDAAMGDIKVVAESGSDDLILHQPVHTVSAKNTIYFVNGLCCRPTVKGDSRFGETIVLEQAARYCANQKDRNRGVVMLDFDGKCDLEYVDVKCDEFGNIDFQPDCDIYRNSFLLVVDGRMFFPDEFDISPSGKVWLDKSKYQAEYSLDRKVCENDFLGRLGCRELASTRNVESDLKIKLTDYHNTFLIVLKRRGLRAFRHDPMQTTSTDTTAQVCFNGLSQGLLMDTATKSVYSFMRTDNDNDFYCVADTTPLKWFEMVAYIAIDKPLEIWARHNNDMSVHASLHDRNPIQGTGLLLRPKFTMIDFVFEG